MQRRAPTDERGTDRRGSAMTPTRWGRLARQGRLANALQVGEL